MHRGGVLLVLVALVPFASATDPESFAPEAVLAAKITATEATVAWLPGAIAADAYRIYGLTGAETTLLAEVPSSEAGSNLTVSAIFDSYGVSGVLGGIESPMTQASATAGPPCIYLAPPNVAVTCLPVIGIPGKGRLPAEPVWSLYVY